MTKQTTATAEVCLKAGSTCAALGFPDRVPWHLFARDPNPLLKIEAGKTIIPDGLVTNFLRVENFWRPQSGNTFN